MTDRVYLSAPDVTELEASYLLDALRSGWVAPLGPHVDAFEREIASRLGVAHAVAVSSGTAALHLALLGLGIGPGDIVVVPTLTFVATANAVAYTGAEPVFVDCDPATGNLDVGLLDQLLRGEGERIRAVTTVDMLGRCADYASILPLCTRYGVPVVEDAAEALGATYRGTEALGATYGARAAGSFGRAAALSFNGNKIVTTSGGGMLLSDDADLAARARYLASQARAPVAHYEHADVGYNYRLSNLLAAVGRAQLRRLDEMMGRRRLLRERYRKLFAPIDGVRILGDDDDGANCWLTAVVVDAAVAGWRAPDLAAYLAERDIETRPLWKPMHLQPAFAGARQVVTGAAERLFETGIALPSGSAMSEPQRTRVFRALEDFLEAAR